MNDPQIEEIVGQLKWLNRQLSAIGWTLAVLCVAVVIFVIVALTRGH